MENIRNAVDVSMRMIANRYDFKGTSARVELLEKDMQIVLSGDTEFQINQIKDILFPSMEKKEPESSKRMESEKIESVSGNKSKQNLKIKSGIEMDLAKVILKTIKESKIKVQASIQGDELRINGTKRDILQECIALVKSNHKDYPLHFGNFRD
jgi:uncharacterized protein YajQ (UPF0234 family)